MVAILDMQISYFFRAIHQRAVLKKQFERIECILVTRERLGE